MKIKTTVFILYGIFLYSCGSSYKSTSYQTISTPVTNIEKVETKSVEAKVIKEDLPKKVAIVVLTAELGEGKNLYENSCNKCHLLYSPKSYTAEQWTPILINMQKRTDLSDEQTAKIYNYLTMN